MTPEGKVKLSVKKIIQQFAEYVWSHWPVLNGMGEPTLDCIGGVGGYAFAVETKAPGEYLTPRQAKTRREMMAAGITVFVIIGRDPFQLGEFKAWLAERAGNMTTARSKYDDERRSNHRPDERREGGEEQSYILQASDARTPRARSRRRLRTTRTLLAGIH